MIVCDVCKKDITNSTINHAWKMTLCCKHYQQKLKYGHFLDCSPYSTFDRNDFGFLNENTAFIVLKTKKDQEVGRVLIDREDLDRLIVFKWRLWKSNVYTGNKKPVKIQYKVLDVEPNGYDNLIDHINGNPLDNRKCNLRIVSQRENAVNKALSRRNKSEFSGVWFDDSRNKWSSEIRIDGKKCYLGRYKNKEDAVYARYIGELKLFGAYRSDRNDVRIKESVEKCMNKEYIESYVKHRLHDIYGL